jgi:signal transduction histidine kinase/CheY-like chemotaxis protein/HPt (histidine-containing phosphotransfer) domain-containing protein
MIDRECSGFVPSRVVRQSRGMGTASTSASRPPPALAVAGAVDAQVDMLYRRNLIPTLAGVPYGALVCAVSWRTVPHAWLLAWFAVKVAIASARVLLDLARRRSEPGVPATSWATRYVVALVLDGLTWTLLPVLAGPAHDLETNVVMIASVIGVGGIGAVVLSTDFRANVAFSGTLLLPAALWETAQGSRLSIFAGVAMVVFLGLILEQGRRAAGDIAQLLRLRFEIAQARDRALEAARSRSDFLATMSHELRTPLNAVIGMAGLLADSGMTEQQRERVDVIRVSAEALLMLIGDILDVSKIEAGKLQVESAPVDLARCVEESLAQIAPAAFAKGLELGYEIESACPAGVESDAARIRQILGNLLGNAVKFTHEGSVTVHVAARLRSDEVAEVTFSVRDTGIGIEPSDASRLFTPFTQADTSTTRKYGGTGLGHAISKNLSELLGGSIGVESKMGKGSTFAFSIVGKALRSSRPRALPINVGLPIVVCGEAGVARDLLAGHLGGLGFAPRAVVSPAAAAEAAAKGDTECVVLTAREAGDLASAISVLRGASATLPILAVVPPGTASRAVAPDKHVAVTSQPVRVGRLLELVEALLVDEAAPATRRSFGDSEVPPGRAGARGTALVVDDNELNRRVAVEMVRRLGLAARAVGSGAAAIEAVKGEAFDFVLMDVQMPDMDGFEATRRVLDATTQSPKPRIIAMTANALSGDRERCLAAGMSEYLTKPVRPQALAKALRVVTDDKPDATEGSGITDVLDPHVLEDLRMLESTSGTALLEDLSATFRVDAPARIEEMRAAIGLADISRVKSIAHRLRGSAATLGANRVFVSATEIEATAATLGASELQALVGQLAKECTRAMEAFDRVIQRIRREPPPPRE